MRKLEKKDNNFSKKQANIFLIVVVLFAFLVVTGVFLSKNLRGTYSSGVHEIQFRGDTNYDLNRYPGYNGPEDGICYTDEYGYLDPECVYTIGCTCREWSHSVSTGPNTQTTHLYSSNMYTELFTSDETYYCVSGSSYASECDIYPATVDCYHCTGNGVDKPQKAINATRAITMSGGTTCEVAEDAYCDPQPEYACYQCTADATVFSWKTDATGDGSCSGGYTKTTKTQAECVYVAPPVTSCYACTLGEGTEYTYATTKAIAASNTGGTNCEATVEANCLNPPESCYACEVNGETKYTNTTTKAKAEQNTEGTNCTIKDKKYCEPVKEEVKENPKTGTAAIIIAWIVGVLALGYAIFYVFKTNKVK